MSGQSADEGELERLDALFELMSGFVQRSEPLTTDERMAREAELFVRPSSHLSAVERLDIYRQQFWLRHRDSLRDDFPGTSALFGQRWDEVVRGYLKEFPPTTPSLRELGFQLPDYLARDPATPQSALDMARLERAYLEVFDAPDEPPLDPAEVAALGPEQWPVVRLRLSQALRLLDLGSHAADLRRMLRAGKLVELDERIEPVYLVVYRRELGLWDRKISRTAYDLLRQLDLGEPLGVACEKVASVRSEAAHELDRWLGEWFADWARSGFIRGVVVD